MNRPIRRRFRRVVVDADRNTAAIWVSDKSMTLGNWSRHLLSRGVDHKTVTPVVLELPYGQAVPTYDAEARKIQEGA